MKRLSITTKQFVNAAITFALVEVSHSVTAIIDGVITGRFLGSTALAGVGLCDIYFSLCAVIGFTLAAAAQNLCALALGKGDREKSDKLYSTIFALTLLSSAVLSIAGIFLAGPLSRMLGAQTDGNMLYGYTKPYLIGLFIGAVPNILLAVISPLLTIDGKSRLANTSSALVLVTDIALDLLNVLVLHWGTFGMGLATSLSYVAGLVPVLYGLFRKDSLFRFLPKNVCFSFSGCIIKNGFPRGVGMIARAVGPMIINLFVLSVASTPGLTALSVKTNIQFLCMAPAAGISGAVLLMAGMFYGEHNPKEIGNVLKSAVAANFIIVFPLALVLLILAPQLSAVYLGTEDAAYPLTVKFLRIYFASLPLVGLNFIAANHLTGCGRSLGANIYNMINECAGLVVFVLVMGKLWGIDGIFWAYFVWQSVLFITYLVIAMVRKSRIQKGKQKLLFLDDKFFEKNAMVYTGHVTSLEDAAAEAEKIQHFCTENGLNLSKSMKIALCMEELADNVVLRGFEAGKNNQIELRVTVDEESVILHMRDDCPKFNFKEHTRNFRPDPEHPESHLGTRAVLGLATEISYTNTLKANNLVIKIA